MGALCHRTIVGAVTRVTAHATVMMRTASVHRRPEPQTEKEPPEGGGSGGSSLSASWDGQRIDGCTLPSPACCCCFRGDRTCGLCELPHGCAARRAMRSTDAGTKQTTAGGKFSGGRRHRRYCGTINASMDQTMPSSAAIRCSARNRLGATRSDGRTQPHRANSPVESPLRG
jgi:hypothetical protein